MHLVRDQHKRQFDTAYHLYLVYSKNASRFLGILIFFTVYIGITIYGNWVPFRIEWNRLSEKYQSIIGPRNELQFHGDLESLLSQNKYRLPIINTEIGGKEFFIVAPLALLGVAIAFWINLKYSNDKLKILTGLSAAHAYQSFAPWVYNFRMNSTLSFAAWQIVIELLPILTLAALLFAYLGQVDFYFMQTKVLIIILVMAIIIHCILFRVPMNPDDSFLMPIVFIALLGMMIYYQVESYSGRSANKWQPLSMNTLFFVGYLEYLFRGASFILMAIFGTAYLPMAICENIVVRTFRTRKLTRLQVKEETIKVFAAWKRGLTLMLKHNTYGYIGYIFQRKMFLRSIIPR